MKLVIILLIVLCFGKGAYAKEKAGRKVQEVKFDGSDVEGVARTPDGAYLMQKRGIKFVPLYKVKKHFDEQLKDSVSYLR